MKTIKIFLSLILTVATVFIAASCNRAQQPSIAPCNLYTLHTVTGFHFVDGYARINADFTGYDDTAQLRVDIRIEKKDFLFFSREIVSESHSSTGAFYQNEFFYPLEEDGVYDCTVVYTVTGAGGEDVITFKDTGEYRLSDYPEHTHIWKEKRVEPTCSVEGRDIAICHCGETKVTLIEKLPHTPGGKKTESTWMDNWVTEHCAVCEEEIRSYYKSKASSSDAASNAAFNTPRSLPEDSPFSNQTCNCPSCMLQRSFAAIEAAKPKKPSVPSIPTVDPWEKYQESLSRDTNPYHINQKNNGIRIFP